MDPLPEIFDNETEHAILAGSILALLIGGVAYAAVHNVRHRREHQLGDARFEYLLRRANETDATLELMDPRAYERALIARGYGERVQPLTAGLPRPTRDERRAAITRPAARLRGAADNRIPVTLPG